MAHQVTGATDTCSELGVHWLGHGGRECQPGQGQAGSPRRAALCACWRGNSTGEVTGLSAADRVRNALREATCPAKRAPR
jgi:hypothetical protein